MQTILPGSVIKFLFVLLLLTEFHSTFSQGVQKPVPKQVVYNTNGSLKSVRYGYQEYLPIGYNTQPSKKWPLIIHMVGLGERGDGSVQDLDTINHIGIPKLIKQGNQYPFLIMSPQPTGKAGRPLVGDEGKFNPDTLGVFIDYILANYHVDPNRVYITAFSAAVIEAYRYIGLNAEKVAAFIPVSGARYYNICRLQQVPVWAFHNLYDNIIPSDKSIDNITELNNCPPEERARLTMYARQGHDAWTLTYSGQGRGKEMQEYDPYNESIYDWLLRHSKKKTVYADAGEDQTVVLPNTSVMLKGSSTPATGVTYLWTQNSGPNTATLGNKNTANLTVSNLVEGTYEFILTCKDAQNNTGEDGVVVHVETSNNDVLAIARFSLINAKTDQVIPAYADLQEGTVINLSNTGLSGSDKYSQLNIDAVTNPTTVGSVKFILRGPVSTAPVENGAPYAIFSDSNGNYDGGSLPVGSYTLTAIPYSEAKKGGVEGEGKTIHFSVVDGAVEEPTPPEQPGNDALAIARFSLINAKTDEVIPAYANLQEGSVINLSNTGLSDSDKYSQLNLEAITSPATVGSVKFILNGPVSTAPVENGAPYAIFGDYNGNYKPGSLPVGSYTLTAIPYSEAKKGGVEGDGKTIHFSVVDGAASPAARVDPTAKAKPGEGNQQTWGREASQAMRLYPNPTTDKLQVVYRGGSGEVLLLSVYNAAGQLIRQKTGIGVMEEEMDFREQPPGMYIAVLQHKGEQLTQKFIVTR